MARVCPPPAVLAKIMARSRGEDIFLPLQALAALARARRFHSPSLGSLLNLDNTSEIFLPFILVEKAVEKVVYGTIEFVFCG